MTPKRIAVAGFQHETNSFAPSQAGWDNFVMADSWPGLLTGRDVISGTRGMNLPIAGAIEAAELAGLEVAPILWCAAEPSGPVTQDAFDRITAMMLDRLSNAGTLDAVYLDLHGAMVTQTHDDGEAAFVRLIREQIGESLPIAVSLDLHANISAELVETADIITIYRTYPHLDMAATGARAVQEVLRGMNDAPRYKAFREVPFLVPLPAQFTGAGPCQQLYQRLDELPANDWEYLELAMGFSAADVACCGPSLVAFAGSQSRADQLADQLLAEINEARDRLRAELMDPTDAVEAALSASGTVVIADVQDNAGAGGNSDTTGLLKALVESQAPRAVLGVIADAEVAKRAHRVGIGSRFEAALGGNTGPDGVTPFVGQFEVLALSDGTIPYTGEMYGGGVAEIGPSCLLKVLGGAGDTQIVVSSLRTQCLDRAFFEHFGVDLTATKIICVKSTVHFRADFDPISDHVIYAAAPGYFLCDLSQITYQKASREILP